MSKKIASLVIVLLFAGSVCASKVWSGADPADNNWNTPGNWQSGIVPVDTYAKFKDALASWDEAVIIDATDVSGDRGEGNPNKIGLGLSFT